MEQVLKRDGDAREQIRKEWIRINRRVQGIPIFTTSIYLVIDRIVINKPIGKFSFFGNKTRITHGLKRGNNGRLSRFNCYFFQIFVLEAERYLKNKFYQ